MSTGVSILARLAFCTLSLIGAFTAGEYSRSAAVSSTRGLSCHGSSQPMTRLEMLFGSARTNGSPIGDDEWTSFVDTEVTPRFPAGLTVLQGPGQWRGQDGAVVKEDSRILVVWHEPNLRSEADIEAIRSAYKVRFEQESVMRVESISCVSF